jgi:hypothetical protein
MQPHGHRPLYPAPVQLLPPARRPGSHRRRRQRPRGGLAALEQRAPGIAFYLCDELGRLRTHVNIFVDKQLVKDRRGLSDPVTADTHIHIIQALSGG